MVVLCSLHQVMYQAGLAALHSHHVCSSDFSVKGQSHAQRIQWPSHWNRTHFPLDDFTCGPSHQNAASFCATGGGVALWPVPPSEDVSVRPPVPATRLLLLAVHQVHRQDRVHLCGHTTLGQPQQPIRNRCDTESRLHPQDARRHLSLWQQVMIACGSDNDFFFFYCSYKQNWFLFSFNVCFFFPL